MIKIDFLVPQSMKVETKATLLIAALILVNDLSCEIFLFISIVFSLEIKTELIDLIIDIFKLFCRHLYVLECFSFTISLIKKDKTVKIHCLNKMYYTNFTV